MLLSEKRSIEATPLSFFYQRINDVQLPLVSTKSPRGLPASTGLYITTFQTRQTNHTSKRLERFRLRLHHPPFILRLSSHQLRARSHELSLSLSLSTRAWLDQCKPSHSQRFTSLFKSTPLTLSYSFVFLFSRSQKPRIHKRSTSQRTRDRTLSILCFSFSLFSCFTNCGLDASTLKQIPPESSSFSCFYHCLGFVSSLKPLPEIGIRRRVCSRPQNRFVHPPHFPQPPL